MDTACHGTTDDGAPGVRWMEDVPYSCRLNINSRSLHWRSSGTVPDPGTAGRAAAPPPHRSHRCVTYKDCIVSGFYQRRICSQSSIKLWKSENYKSQYYFMMFYVGLGSLFLWIPAPCAVMYVLKRSVQSHSLPWESQEVPEYKKTCFPLRVQRTFGTIVRVLLTMVVWMFTTVKIIKCCWWNSFNSNNKNRRHQLRYWTVSPENQKKNFNTTHHMSSSWPVGQI